MSSGGMDYPDDDFSEEHAWFPTTREIFAWLWRNRWEIPICSAVVVLTGLMVWLFVRRLIGD